MKIHQMPNCLLTVFLMCISISGSYSQLVTSRAVIKINSGGIMYVNGNFLNRDSLSNHGTLEVTGSFTNTSIDPSALGNHSLVRIGGPFSNGGSLRNGTGAGTAKLDLYNATSSLNNQPNARLLNGFNDTIIFSSASSGVNLINEDTLSNLGVIISKNYVHSGASARTYNSGRIEAQTNFTINNGVYSQNNSGTVALTSTTTGTLNLGANNLWNLEVNAPGATLKNLNSACTVRNSLSLFSGVLVTGVNTLYMDSSASLVKADIASNSSYVRGTLTRRKQPALETLAFPVATGTAYRPLVITDLGSIPGPQPVYSVSVSTTANGGSPGTGLISLFQSPTWTVERLSPTHHDYSVRTYFTLNELGTNTDLDTIFLAQANSINGTYESKGQRNLNTAAPASLSNISSRYVVDDFSTAYFALGVNRNIQARALTWLSGSFNPLTGRMAGVPVDTLISRFGHNGSASLNMNFGYSVPDSAVDVIRLALRSGLTAATTVDTAYAWMLRDGTIVDFETGENEYVTFKRALPLIDYRMVISHRNHLDIMSSNTINFTSANDQTFDLKDIANIYGAGASPVGGSFGMYCCNARNNDQEVNAADLSDVIRDQDLILFGYNTTDVNLDGVANANDLTPASEANTNLYFSTTP